MIDYYQNLSLENLFYIDENGIVQEEEWKDVPMFEKIYQGSDLGRIKALSRNCENSLGIRKIFNEKIIKQSVSTDGYLRVVFRKNKSPFYFKTHKIIAMCFLNHFPCKYLEVIDHLNNNKLDNRRINLATVTPRFNTSKNKLKNNPYTGISYNKTKKYWRASIQINGKNIALGCNKIPEIASNLYNIALENINYYDGNNENFRSLIRSKL